MMHPLLRAVCEGTTPTARMSWHCSSIFQVKRTLTSCCILGKGHWTNVDQVRNHGQITLLKTTALAPISNLASTSNFSSDQLLTGVNRLKLNHDCKYHLGREGTSLPATLNASLHTSSKLQKEDTGERKPSKLKLWWQHQRSMMRDAPSAALALGFSGLVPFMVPAIHSIFTMSCGPNIAFAQAAYGACILSFLGGVRWGYAIAPQGAPSWPALTFSVLPSLVAWSGLMMPIQPGLFCIIAGLGLAGGADTFFKSYPPWFRSLRFILTTFAILSISVTFVFSIMYPPPAPEHGYNFKKLIKIAQIIVED